MAGIGKWWNNYFESVQGYPLFFICKSEAGKGIDANWGRQYLIRWKIVPNYIL